MCCLAVLAGCNGDAVAWLILVCWLVCVWVLLFCFSDVCSLVCPLCVGLSVVCGCCCVVSLLC